MTIEILKTAKRIFVFDTDAEACAKVFFALRKLAQES